MKVLIVLILAMSASAFASDFTYQCKQRTDRTPVDRSIGKLSVSITHVRNIDEATEYRGDYMDSIDVVKVVVSSTKNGKTTVLRTMNTISTSEDVMFMIQEKDMTFHLYLDELEEASIKTIANGKLINVSLVCE